MASPAEPTTRRGMTFPFFLSLVLFIAVLCDVWLSESDFIPSAAYKHQPYIAAGLLIFGLLLWLWVLAAARRRAGRFEGPVELARGNSGVLQPILATVFIVSAVNLAYGHTIPKWLNVFAADEVASEPFIVAGEIRPERDGCHATPATHPRYGEVALCLPQRLVEDVEANPGGTVTVTGSQSWFGIEPRRYTVAEAAPIAIEDATPPEEATIDLPPSTKLGNAPRP